MSKMIRDAAKVKACIKELPTGQLLATQACKIQIPKRFEDRGLAVIGNDTYVYGIYALILEDNTYAVSNITAMVKINPYKTLEVKIDEVSYYEFYFEANSILAETVHLVRRNLLMFNVIDEFMFQGNVPWYIEYEDLGKLLDTSEYHADSKVGQNHEVTELIASFLGRVKEDRTKYYRTYIESFSDLKTRPPAFVALKSVFYSATNTLNKLAGSYFNDGVVSALVNPSQSTERIELLLRC